MKKIIMINIALVLFSVAQAKENSASFINLTFDGIGFIGQPYIFWPTLLLSVLLVWKSTIYVRLYYALVLCDLFLAFWLFHNTPFVWLQDYALWFERTFTVIDLKNIDIALKVFIAVIYITIPIKWFLFVKHVQRSPVFTREFIISPIRKFKTSKTGDFLFSELDESERETLEQHSYLKMILYLVVLFASSLVVLMTLTWAASADLIQPQGLGGMAMWFEWDLTRILFFVIFTGTLYLMMKDWIIAFPSLIRNLWGNLLLLKDNIVNVFLNLKNRNN